MVQLPDSEYQKLQDAREIAESTISTIREPLLVLDGELKIVSASRAFYQFFKATPEETEHKFLYDLGNKQWDIPVLRKLLGEILPDNEVINDYEVEHAFPVIGRRTMLLNARRIPRPPAKPRMILLAMEDITVRKIQAENAFDLANKRLGDSEALFATVVENIPLMLFLKEAKDLRFVIFNRAGEELLGYDRKDLLGKNNLDLFPPEQAANFMANDREVLDGKAGFIDIPEEPITTAKQGVRILHTRKVRVKGDDGVTKFLLGISEDITERKQAEKELKKKLAELETIYQAAMGREDKILDLKAKITELKAIIDTKK